MTCAIDVDGSISNQTQNRTHRKRSRCHQARSDDPPTPETPIPTPIATPRPIPIPTYEGSAPPTPGVVTRWNLTLVMGDGMSVVIRMRSAARPSHIAYKYQTHRSDITNRWHTTIELFLYSIVQVLAPGRLINVDAKQ